MQISAAVYMSLMSGGLWLHGVEQHAEPLTQTKHINTHTHTHTHTHTQTHTHTYTCTHIHKHTRIYAYSLCSCPCKVRTPPCMEPTVLWTLVCKSKSSGLMPSCTSLYLQTQPETSKARWTTSFTLTTLSRLVLSGQRTEGAILAGAKGLKILAV